MRLGLGSKLNRLAIGFAVIAGLGLSSKANAGLLIEPYLGYQGGTLNLSSNTIADANMQMKGVTFGGRLGLTVPLFFVALDYSSANGNVDGWGYTNTSTIQNQLAAVIGMQIPFLRFFVGYAFMNDLKIQDTADLNLSGSAVKAGASFTALPFISLNLEYIMNTYNHVKEPGVDQGIPGAMLNKAKSDAILFSVSVPFDI